MSKKGFRRTITIDMDYTSVIKGTENVNEAMRGLDANFRKNSEGISQYGVASQQLGLAKEHLTQKVSLQATKVEDLKDRYEKYSKELGESNKTTINSKKAYDNAVTTLMRFEKQLEDVTDEVDKQNTSLGKIITGFSDFKDSALDAGVDIDALSNKLIGLGVGLTGLGVAAAKMAMDFDNEMAKVKSIADFSDTTLTIDDLKESVLSASAEFNVSAGDMANGMYELISADTQLVDSHQALINSALLAKTGFTDMETAVDVLTSFTNAYNLTIEEQTELVDKLIITQNDGKVTIDELGGSFGKIAGMAKESGVSVDELLGALAAVTGTGLPASETLNSLKAVLSNIIKPSKEAQETAEALGISFNSSALESKGLAGFLKEVETRAGGNTDALSTLFGSVNALNTVMVLTGSGSEKFGEVLENLENSGGTAQQAFNDLLTPGEQLSSSINKLKNSFIETGGAFQPLVTGVSKVIDGFTTLSPAIITVGSVLGVMAIVIGGTIKAINTLSTTMTAIEAIKTLFAKRTATETATLVANTAATTVNATAQTGAAGAAGVLTGANTALGLSFSAVAIPIAVVVAAILLVVAAFYLLSKKSKDAGNDMKNSIAQANKEAAELQKTMENAGKTSNRYQSPMGSQMNSYAGGTNFHQGGKALVGEEGPEIVDLPRGSKVHTASESKNMLSGNQTIVYETINITADMSKIDDVEKLKKFLNNYRSVSNQNS